MPKYDKPARKEPCSLEYRKCVPIEPCTQPMAAWLIECEDGTKYLQVCAQELPAEDVVEMVGRHLQLTQRYSIQRFDCGLAKVQKIINSYCGDSRQLSNDMRVFVRDFR